MFCLGTHTGSGHNAGASGAPAGQGAGTGAGHTVGGGGETAWLGRHKRNAPDTRAHNSSTIALNEADEGARIAYRRAPIALQSTHCAHIHIVFPSLGSVTHSLTPRLQPGKHLGKQ